MNLLDNEIARAIIESLPTYSDSEFEREVCAICLAVLKSSRFVGVNTELGEEMEKYLRGLPTDEFREVSSSIFMALTKVYELRGKSRSGRFHAPPYSPGLDHWRN